MSSPTVAEGNVRPRRRGGRPTLTDAQALADRIVDVATKRFLGEGFEATSLETIAREAGVSKRTLYSRFDSKATLFKAMVVRYIAGYADAIAPLSGEGVSCIEQVIHVGIEMLRAVLNPGAIALERVVMAEAGRFPELARIVHDQATAHLRAPLRQALQAGMANGEMVAFDVPAMAELLSDALIIGNLRRAALGLEPAEATPAQCAKLRARVELLFRGLAHNE